MRSLDETSPVPMNFLKRHSSARQKTHGFRLLVCSRPTTNARINNAFASLYRVGEKITIHREQI